MSLERARKHLDKYGLAERIHLTEDSSATVELAALAVGVEPGRIAKTLSFLVDGQPILLLAEGTARIDNRKFKNAFLTKAKMIPPDQVEELVGHAPGGVCPFGINKGIRVYLDISLKKYETVFPASGTGNSDIELTIPELEECSEMTGWVDFIAPQKVNILETAMKTVENLRGLVGIMVVVGILNQTMTLTGARGLLSLGVVKLPIAVLFAALWLILPISEGVLQYAVAPLFGVPLIMLFNMLGYDPVISLAAWSVMWPVGDCLPPTAVVGRAAVLELDYKGDYYKGFIKSALVPMLFILLLSSLMMIFSKEIGAFLL